MASIFLKMSIVTQDNFVVLGINGVDSFSLVFGEEFESVFEIDDDFINKLKLMQVHLFGFTQEFKDKMILIFEAKKGQKAFITSDWIVNYESPRSQQYMKFVRFLNENKDFDTAKELAFNLNKN